MKDVELLFGLVAAAAVLVWVARRVGAPYPIFLVAGGLAIGVIPGVPELRIEPDVVFLVFIPPLVHASGHQISPRHLRVLARPIGQMAIALVVLTIGAVAVVAHTVIGGLSWEAAVVLGAVVAPTDPVAATAMFRRLGVPPRVTTLVEGESLLNDGTALVVYKIAIAVTVAGGYSVADGARDLLAVSAGGVAIGLAGGWLVAKARERLDDAVVEITVTLLTPYLLFIVAEELGTSGILAAVVSGIYLGWRGPQLFTATTRIQAAAFWEVFTFLLESVLFILIGLQFPGVVESLSAEPASDLILWAAAVSLTAIVVRIVFLLVVGGVDEAYEDRVRGRQRPKLSARERLVVGWSGMRGAVSLAAALAIPLTTDAGAAFPARDLILFLTLCVIAVTLVLQGLTLPALVKRLGVEDTRTSARRRATARFSMVQAALDRIADMSFDSETPPGVVERARNMYTSRARQLAGECEVGVEVEQGDDRAWADLRRQLLDVERGELLRLRNEGRVPHRVVLDVERDLDLEQSRLESRPFDAIPAGAVEQHR